MALTVEDGTCVPGADSWIDLADARELAASYGLTLPTDDVEAEAALRFGALWLSNNFAWDGKRTCSSVNMLAWPRTGVTDCDKNAIESDAIPPQIVLAQVYAGGNQSVLNPVVTPGQQVRRERVDVIEVEYMTPTQQGVSPGTYDPLSAAKPVLSFVNDLIDCFAEVGYNKLPWPYVV